jgi:hypothetical protein
MFGGSLYSGDTGQDGGFGGRLTLGEVHAQSRFRGVQLRALYSRVTLDDVDDINAANGLTGDESVGETLGGWYVEGGYDIGALMNRSELSLTPFVRYEAFDTQRDVPAGFLRNPANDQNILTIGVNFKPIPQTVIKVDWQDVDNKANSGTDQWNVSLGYIF